MTILDQIIQNKRAEVAQLKTKYSFHDFEKTPFFEQNCRSLKKAIQAKKFGIIAEFKRKSPSAGIINEDLDLAEIARIYELNEMAAMSILTDKHYFGGTNDDIAIAKTHSSLPILRKEFIVDELQIFESKAIGADAILLIAEVLSKQEITSFTTIAKSIGLEVILELHEPIMIDKIDPQIDILGVNNRSLKLQKTNLQTSFDLLPYLPHNLLKISESGISSKKELLALKEVGFEGALIGESILRVDKKSDFLKQLNPSSYVA